MKTTNAEGKLETYKKSELKKMNWDKLYAIAEELGTDFKVEIGTDEPSKPQLIALILQKQEEQTTAPTEEPATSLHRELTAEEEVEFRGWARENYRPGEPIDPMWHPVVKEECAEINASAEVSSEKPASSVETAIIADLLPDTEYKLGGKRYKVVRRYTDEKERPHVVVKSGNGPEMDLWQKNHINVEVVIVDSK